MPFFRTGHGERDARESDLAERVAASGDRAAAHFAVVVDNVNTLTAPQKEKVSMRDMTKKAHAVARTWPR
jgi:hypothetical protein